MLVKRFGLVIKKPARVAFGVIFRLGAFSRSRIELNLILVKRSTTKSIVSPGILSEDKVFELLSSFFLGGVSFARLKLCSNLSFKLFDIELQLVFLTRD